MGNHSFVLPIIGMHFLRKNELHRERALERRHAVVTVRFEGPDRLIVVPGQIGVSKSDALFVPLSKRVVVLDPETLKPIEASGEFWVSTETFNPFHVIADLRSQ